MSELSREMIRNELSERMRRNPRYSLRAFARATGVSHTVLSLVLSGKRTLSRKAATKLSGHLELAPRTGEFRTLTLDTFAVISDWFHFAILSALELPGARWDAAWLSRSLRIGKLQARLAMERLARLGLVERGPGGRWRQSGKPLQFDNRNSTAATRRFHRQLLERAIESLENDPAELRDFSAMTLALDPDQIPYAKERLRDFRRDLMRDLETRGGATAVYELTLQLFPVTRIPTRKKEPKK